MSPPPPPRRAPGAVAQVLSLPPHWLTLYEDFISKNAGQVSQIESALRSLTYIIPGSSHPRRERRPDTTRPGEMLTSALPSPWQAVSATPR